MISEDLRQMEKFRGYSLRSLLTTCRNSRGNLRTVKTYTVTLVYRRIVTLNVYFVHTVIN